ncbi:MAG: pyridoxamine 5'-phosphate oxidase family protein [Actinomycetota bacterium]
MGKTYDEIDEATARWMTEQHVYFVATGPLSGDGMVNVSPKGNQGSFAVLGPRRVAYLDITGSGVETIAHLRENGRIVVMFCAFEGRPKIMRLHGEGRVHQRGGASFDALLPHFTGSTLREEGLRSIIEIDVHRIASSCGYSVPLMSFEGVREHGELWVDKRLTQHGPAGVLKYQEEQNLESLDGLPGLDPERVHALETERVTP